MDNDKIKKLYSSITRVQNSRREILVFRHSIAESRHINSERYRSVSRKSEDAVIRRMKEETGLSHFEVEKLIAGDYW